MKRIREALEEPKHRTSETWPAEATGMVKVGDVEAGSDDSCYV